MTCQTIQHRVLALDDPCLLPEVLKEHVAHCPHCQQWFQVLLRVEESIPLLPIPSSEGRAALIRRLLRNADAEGQAVEVPLELPPPSLSDIRLAASPASSSALNIPSKRPRQWFANGALLAILVLVLVGLGLLRDSLAPSDKTVFSKPGPGKDDLLAKIVKWDLTLARENSAEGKIEELTELADDLFAEARDILKEADAKDLEDLAELYHHVVRDGLMTQALTLHSPGWQHRVKACADRLERTSNAIDGLKRNADRRKIDSLNAIARTARDGNHQLLSLLREQLP